MKKLRDYQSKTIEDVFKAKQDGIKSMLITYATGLGKTLTAANIINKTKGKTLWLTHTEELIEQSAMSLISEEFDGRYIYEIKKAGGIIKYLDSVESSGLFGNTSNEIKNLIGVVKQHRFDIDSKIVVASVQTIHRRLDKISPEHFELIIADEAHMSMAKTWTKTITYFNTDLRIGLTATPTRLDGLSLVELFEKIVSNYDIKYGIDNGYLVEIDGIRIKTKLNLDKVRTTAGELNQADLEKEINIPERNQLIVDSYKKYANGKQAIVYCVDIKHAKDLDEVFRKNGIKSAFVVGDESICPDRSARIDLFKSGELTVLVNVNILIAGFDHDMVECIIMARPTKSLVLYCQAIGRGTRTKNGVIWNLDSAEERITAIRKSDKPKLIILDIVDNTTRHNLINTWTLDKDKSVEDKVFVTKENKELLLAEIAKKEAQRKLKHELNEDKRQTLIRLPKVELYNSGKNLEPATEKQLQWLKREGYDIVNNSYTKFQASEIISSLPINVRSAYYKVQLDYIRSWGYDLSNGITVGQLGAALKEIEKRKAFEKIKNSSENLPFKDLE